MQNNNTVARGRAALARLLLGACCAALVGCGGGGSGSEGGASGGGQGSGPLAGADYFPLAVGDRWSYNEGGSISTARVTGTRPVGGTTALVVRFDDDVESYEDLYHKSAAGIYFVPPESADAWQRAVAAVPILKLPIVAGESFVPLDRTLADVEDFDHDGRLESTTLHAQVTVIGFETVTTAAGTMNQVAHTRTVLRQSVTLSGSGQQVVITLTSDDWYAPDVGLVRNVSTITGSGGDSGAEQNLAAYRVGTRRSETVAPTVLSRTPAAAGVLTSGSIGVRFSEAMDRRAGSELGFTLRGPDGQPVGGQLLWADETSFSFVPAANLVSGVYTAQLDGAAEDLAGNPLGQAQSWSFTFDAVGPSVVATSPAQAALEVALTSTITITFDDELDPATVTADAVRLREQRTGTELAITLSLSGRTISITPQAPLQRAMDYRVAVTPALKDEFGNPAAPYELAFKADPGRFAASTRLLGLGISPGSTAIGDFNGDGRGDVAVVSDGVGADVQRAVRIAYQQSDGSLAPAIAVDSGLQCASQSIVAADLNADGRTDLAVSSTCGMEMLLQRSDGTLHGNVLTSAYGEVKAVLPITADGRNALLVQGVEGHELKLYLWRQTAPGVFAAPVAMPTAMNNTNTAATADIDGDGRVDLVLTGLLASNNGSGLAVLYQQADGGFGNLRELPNTLAVPPSHGAAGDINGDGRSDLVYTTHGNSPTYIGYLLQQADGSFGPMTPMTTYDMPDELIVADVTGDGRADVVVTHSGWLAIGVYEQGASGLQPEVRFEAPYGACHAEPTVALGDLTGDGRIDIAYCGEVLRQRAVPMAGASTAHPGSRAALLHQQLRRLGDLRR